MEYVCSAALPPSSMFALCTPPPADAPQPLCALPSACAAQSTEMDTSRFAKLCRECKLIDKAFNQTRADLVFAKAKQQVGFRSGNRGYSWE